MGDRDNGWSSETYRGKCKLKLNDKDKCEEREHRTVRTIRITTKTN